MTALTLSLASCGPEAPKNLVLYYSQTGATEAVAQEIQSLLGADIESIEIQNPYSGTYGETIARVSQERENGTLPEIRSFKVRCHLPGLPDLVRHLCSTYRLIGKGVRL